MVIANPPNSTRRDVDRDANQAVGRGAYRRRYPLRNHPPLSPEESGEIADDSLMDRNDEGAASSQYDNVTQ